MNYYLNFSDGLFPLFFAKLYQVFCLRKVKKAGEIIKLGPDFHNVFFAAELYFLVD